jgi:hypothetical protein
LNRFDLSERFLIPPLHYGKLGTPIPYCMAVSVIGRPLDTTSIEYLKDGKIDSNLIYSDYCKRIQDIVTYYTEGSETLTIL